MLVNVEIRRKRYLHGGKEPSQGGNQEMRRYNSTRSTIIMTILILVMFSICMDVQRAKGAEKREFGVAAGHHFAIALKKDGTVWGWGSNSTGQMATGKVTEKSTLKPTKIAGLKDINKVVAGDFHAFAMANGKVWGWGLNRDGVNWASILRMNT